MLGQHWGILGYTGIYWDAVLRAEVPASPQELGKGNGESLAALKQALQLAHVRLWGGQRCPAALRDGHEGISCATGGIQLNPKPSALKGKEKALCSHG